MIQWMAIVVVVVVVAVVAVAARTERVERDAVHRLQVRVARELCRTVGFGVRVRLRVRARIQIRMTCSARSRTSYSRSQHLDVPTSRQLGLEGSHERATAASELPIGASGSVTERTAPDEITSQG